MIFPMLVLVIVFLLISVRGAGRFRLSIWQVMLFGALAVLLSGSISPSSAVESVDLDVIFFLFGMFVIGEALDRSGYLAHVSYRLFKRAGSLDSLVLFLLFGAGLASALLMNDTLAIIGTPVVLLLARKHCISPKVLLLALCFAVTIGSVMSPIGNPQNLLIAMGGGIDEPFSVFLRHLLVPTLINLVACFFILKLFFKQEFRCDLIKHSQEPILDHDLSRLSRYSLALVVLMISLKVALVVFFPEFDFSLTAIALVSACPILFFSRRRFEVVRNIDWSTLVFFVAMFILMRSVWDSGFFQAILGGYGGSLLSLPMIFGVSVVLSQFISNVPLVALYLPMLSQAGAGPKEFVALAAGSTIAGNLLILGAASNVIVIQNAESRSGETITFWEFAKVGVPLTLVNVFVYWVFLRFF